MSGTKSTASLQEKEKSKLSGHSLRTWRQRWEKEVSNVTKLLSWPAHFKHLTREISALLDGCNFPHRAISSSSFFFFPELLIQKNGREKAHQTPSPTQLQQLQNKMTSKLPTYSPVTALSEQRIYNSTSKTHWILYCIPLDSSPPQIHFFFLLLLPPPSFLTPYSCPASNQSNFLNYLLKLPSFKSSSLGGLCWHVFHFDGWCLAKQIRLPVQLQLIFKLTSVGYGNEG